VLLLPSSASAVTSVDYGGSTLTGNKAYGTGQFIKPNQTETLSSITFFYEYQYATTSVDYTVTIWELTTSTTTSSANWNSSGGPRQLNSTIYNTTITPTTSYTYEREMNIPIIQTLVADRTYAITIHNNFTDTDNSTTTGFTWFVSSSTPQLPDDEFLGSFLYHYDNGLELVHPDYDVNTNYDNYNLKFTTEDESLGDNGILVKIDSIDFINASTEESWTFPDCVSNSNYIYTPYCSSATTTEGIGITWAFTSSLTPGSHTIHTQIVDYETGGPPSNLTNSSSYNEYNEITEAYTSELDVFIVGNLSSTGVATTSGIYSVSVCAEPEDVFNGAYECTYMVVCNGDVTEAECQTASRSAYFGAMVDTDVGITCNLTDIACILKKLFIPSEQYMKTLVLQATSTIANAWPIGYMYREYESYQNATTAEFIISLDMSSFQSQYGPGITNLTASGTPVSSLNLTEASQHAEVLSPGLISLIDDMIWAFFWLFFAWRILFGLMPAVSGATSSKIRYDRLERSSWRSYADRQMIYDKRKQK